MKKLLLGFTLLSGFVFASDELKLKIKLHTNTQEQNTLMPATRYISDNISCPQGKSWIQEGNQNVFTANVPLISTYDPEPFGLLWPALSLHTRVDDISMYFVVQQKLDRALSVEDGDKVTVKYHSLIADGINTGVGEPNDKVLKGKFNLRDSEGNSLIGDYRDMEVIAHDNLWSGPENDDVLRKMITSYTSNDNSVIISELIINDDIQNSTFIDSINLGIKKIVTVHVLLNEQDFESFVTDMNDYEITKDDSFLENYLLNQNAVQAIRDGLELYTKEINKIDFQFDEYFYLEEYPDVAEAVKSGFYKNGLEHYMKYGINEGRKPILDFNENFYLKEYPDVAEAVKEGIYANGLTHYNKYGKKEGRNPFNIKEFPNKVKSAKVESNKLFLGSPHSGELEFFDETELRKYIVEIKKDFYAKISNTCPEYSVLLATKILYPEQYSKVLSKIKSNQRIDDIQLDLMGIRQVAGIMGDMPNNEKNFWLIETQGLPKIHEEYDINKAQASQKLVDESNIEKIKSILKTNSLYLVRSGGSSAGHYFCIYTTKNNIFKIDIMGGEYLSYQPLIRGGEINDDFAEKFRYNGKTVFYLMDSFEEIDFFLRLITDDEYRNKFMMN
ncbi:SAM-dependent methyltransferase domain protein [Francisella sp. TX07-6608]|nr:SAM-dependent methyltransferase domain protein [Francisella sp. TX07-6608]